MEQITGNSQLLQKMNRLKVLDYIRKNPDTTRPIIAQETGLSLSSITNITSYLIGQNLITESGVEDAQRVGRKSTLLRFHAQAYGLVCIFLGVGSINISYTDLEGHILTNIQEADSNMSSRKMIEVVRRNVSSLIDKYGREQILGISVGISGLVLDNGRFVLSSSLKWREFDLKAILENETGLPVFIENVSLLKAVWYFFCKNDLDCDNLLLVDMENGIGATQYYQGSINRAMLGEIGHTTVEKDGDLCFCGNKGCLEIMCSEQKILHLYEQYSGDTATGLAYVAERLDAGDDDARRAVSECAVYLGIGLANLVNLCKPSAILINAGLFHEIPSFIDLAVAEMKERAYPALIQNLIINQVSIREEDIVRGAAFNLCDRLFDISFSGNIVE